MKEEWRRNKYGGLFKVTNDYMNKKIRGENVEQDNKKSYQLTDNQINQVIDESVSQWDDNYAKLYMTKINPNDFLDLTTSDNMWVYIKDETKELDLPKIQNTKYVADMMYLDIDLETGEVRGHEGRHRMMALRNAGYKEVDIVVFPYNYEKYNAKEYTNKKITAQEGTGFASNKKDFSTNLKKLVPVSKANIERIKNRDY